MTTPAEQQEKLWTVEVHDGKWRLVQAGKILELDGLPVHSDQLQGIADAHNATLSEPKEKESLGIPDAPSESVKATGQKHLHRQLATQVAEELDQLRRAEKDCFYKTVTLVMLAIRKACHLCANCGEPAACFGQYEDMPEGFACDDCCGHGNEDGHCEPVDVPSVVEGVSSAATGVSSPNPSGSPVSGASSDILMRDALTMALDQWELLSNMARDQDGYEHIWRSSDLEGIQFRHCKAVIASVTAHKQEEKTKL